MIYYGRMTDTLTKAGGIWVIGDSHYSKVPKHPGKNHGEFLVKSWTAFPDKYAHGQYEFKDRNDEQRWEYVRVMVGQLVCVLGSVVSPVEKRIVLDGRNPDINIAPAWLRKWEFPDGCEYAAGISILHTLRQPYYSFCFWDQPDSLMTHRATHQDSWQYMEIFNGDMTMDARGILKHHFCAGYHLFLSPGICPIWSSDNPTSGVSICFKN